MEERSLKSIEEKLDVIIKLLCSRCIGGMSKTDSILLLNAVGVDREMICQLTGSTPASVASTVYVAKKGNKENRSRNKSREAQPNE